jgi:hypothetical protein
LDLNGTAVPHTYQMYTTSFTAANASTNISFAFREDPAFLGLDDVSVTTGGGPNLITNGGFEAGPLGASAPTGWTYLNSFGATFGGAVSNNGSPGPHSGSLYYTDGAVQAYDGITQAIATTPAACTQSLSFSTITAASPLSRVSARMATSRTRVVTESICSSMRARFQR